MRPSGEIEAALVRELRATFLRLNQTYFKGALRHPQIALSDASTFWGRYTAATRTIELSRPFVMSGDWGRVVEVLKHELAHQYVIDVLQAEEGPHGPVFQSVCERLGIDGRAQGLPTAAEPEADSESAAALARVQRLLALAQSDNQHEAEAAAAAAARLMLRHNLEEARSPRASQYGFRHLGRVTGRIKEWERRLGGILSEHFFVDVIWVPAYRPHEAKQGNVMEIIGSPANLELASYVYSFLSHTAQQLWDAHRRSHHIAGNRERFSYFAGVMSGFAHKLANQAREHQAAGLVWVPHPDLATYVRKRHPHVRTVSHRGHRRGAAFHHGHQAGRDVVLHRGLAQGPSGQVRLLRG